MRMWQVLSEKLRACGVRAVVPGVKLYVVLCGVAFTGASAAGILYMVGEWVLHDGVGRVGVARGAGEAFAKVAGQRAHLN